MKKRAEPDFSVARGLFTVPRLSHGLKRGQHFPRNPVFSREQARLAPRAHVRELLCGTQSSKERLRRSRTESSAAPPAIEELAGEARQVRPARAACGFVSTDLGFLTGGEVRRAPGPPAPSTNLSPQRPNMPPLSCSRTTEAGSFPPGAISVVSRTFITIMLFHGHKRGQHFHRNRAACGFVSTDFGFLTGGEVRRAPGPPAPATNLSPQRPNMPPSSCSRTTEV